MKNHIPITKNEALRVSRSLKERLMAKNLPICQVILYGSSARNTAQSWSDIDIAIVHEPFLPTRTEEVTALAAARSGLDVRIEVISFHPSDLEDKYNPIVAQIQRDGIPV